MVPFCQNITWVSLQPTSAGKITIINSAGNPRGMWILGGGESPEKFGLSVKRIHGEIEVKSGEGFLTDSPEIP